ncbi:hypothetical protein ACH3XW_42845 [Acanthocheilonema viteae]
MLTYVPHLPQMRTAVPASSFQNRRIRCSSSESSDPIRVPCNIILSRINPMPISNQQCNQFTWLLNMFP